MEIGFMVKNKKFGSFIDISKKIVLFSIISLPFVFFPIDDRLSMKTYGFKIGCGLYFCNSPLAEKPFLVVYEKGIPLIVSFVAWTILVAFVFQIRKKVKKHEAIAAVVNSLFATLFLLTIISFVRNMLNLLWDLWSSHSSYQAIIHVQYAAIWGYYFSVIISLSCGWVLVWHNVKFFNFRSRVFSLLFLILAGSTFFYVFFHCIIDDFKTLSKIPTYYAGEHCDYLELVPPPKP